MKRSKREPQKIVPILRELGFRFKEVYAPTSDCPRNRPGDSALSAQSLLNSGVRAHQTRPHARPSKRSKTARSPSSTRLRRSTPVVYNWTPEEVHHVAGFKLAMNSTRAGRPTGPPQRTESLTHSAAAQPRASVAKGFAGGRGRVGSGRGERLASQPIVGTVSSVSLRSQSLHAWCARGQSTNHRRWMSSTAASFSGPYFHA